MDHMGFLLLTQRPDMPMSSVAEVDANMHVRAHSCAVVFSSPSVHGMLVVMLLLVGPLVILSVIPMILQDHDSTEEEKKIVINILDWSAVGILLAYALVLPRCLEVRTDGSVGVVTFLPGLTWSFIDKVSRASPLESILDGALSPRYKFATALDNCVLCRRSTVGWSCS